MEGGDNGKKRKPRRRAVRRKKASKQKRITQFLLPVPEERKEGSRPQVQKLASKRKKGWAEFQADKDYFSDGELYFSSDKRRQAKVEYQVKPYFRPCTRFFSQHDVATRPEDFLLMARSYRSYQAGEQVRLAEMTLREANAYLVLKGQMLEERGRETGTQEEEQKEEHVQLSHSEARKYREFRFLREFTREDRPGGMRIARRLGMRPKVVYRLMQRLRRHGDIVPRKRGTRSRVTPEMLAFLQGWFTTDGNVGKSFKYAYGALVAAFGEEQVGVTEHGCYKAFRKRTDYSYKRIQRVKVQSNTPANKQKRVRFLRRFLPYHQAEAEGRCEIVFIDEAGFNLDKQGTSYA